MWIRDADDEVIETSLLTDPTDVDAAKAGSGEWGKAIFRNGLSYSVSASEETLLTAAGYTVT